MWSELGFHPDRTISPRLKNLKTSPRAMRGMATRASSARSAPGSVVWHREARTEKSNLDTDFVRRQVARQHASRRVPADLKRNPELAWRYSLLRRPITVATSAIQNRAGKSLRQDKPIAQSRRTHQRTSPFFTPPPPAYRTNVTRLAQFRKRNGRAELPAFRLTTPANAEIRTDRDFGARFYRAPSGTIEVS